MGTTPLRRDPARQGTGKPSLIEVNSDCRKERSMDIYYVMGGLVLVILSAGAIYAYLESVKTADRLHSRGSKVMPADQAPSAPPPDPKPAAD